jgi:hypothetical protein
LQFSYVKYFDFPKGGYMSDQAIHSGTDVDVFRWVVPEYFIGHKQILMKIMAGGYPTFLESFMQTGIEFAKWKFPTPATGLTLDFIIISQIKR